MQLLTLLKEIVFEPELDLSRVERDLDTRRKWYKEVFTPAVNEYLSKVSEIMGRKYTFRDGVKNGISVKYWFSKSDRVWQAVEYIQANPEIKVGDSIIKVKSKLVTDSRGGNADLRVHFTSDKIDRPADRDLKSLMKQHKDL